MLLRGCLRAQGGPPKLRRLRGVGLAADVEAANGIIASNIADLLADHVTGRPRPAYAPAPSRYEDPAYRALLETWGDSG